MDADGSWRTIQDRGRNLNWSFSSRALIPGHSTPRPIRKLSGTHSLNVRYVRYGGSGHSGRSRRYQQQQDHAPISENSAICCLQETKVRLQALPASTVSRPRPEALQRHRGEVTAKPAKSLVSSRASCCIPDVPRWPTDLINRQPPATHDDIVAFLDQIAQRRRTSRHSAAAYTCFASARTIRMPGRDSGASHPT
jgi:hypothetical protein